VRFLEGRDGAGDFVVVDQFIDRTFAREKSFFGEGVVAHVSMAHPVSSRLAGMAAEESAALGVRTHRGGTYLAMEGPRFSSLAEFEALSLLGLRRDRDDQHA